MMALSFRVLWGSKLLLLLLESPPAPDKSVNDFNHVADPDRLKK